jgi:hypothetical protein
MNPDDRTTSAAQPPRSNGQAADRHVSSTPGGSPSIPLETEPLVFFHPLLAGSVRPGGVQPVRATLLLEEEPATWPELVG